MKATVVASIANDVEIIRIAKKIAKGNDLYKDLIQYLCEVLLNMTDEKIQHASDNNYLKYLCVRIMNLAMNKPRHPFAVEYGHLCNNVSFDDAIIPMLTDYSVMPIATHSEEDIEQDYSDKQSAVEAYLSQEITQDNFFDITIFNLWYQGDSYRVIGNKIGVHHMVVHNSIKRSREAIAKIYG